jgi:hypothetical protein
MLDVRDLLAELRPGDEPRPLYDRPAGKRASAEDAG